MDEQPDNLPQIKKVKKRGYVYFLSAGHLCADLNQGALPAILPFFIVAYHFNYAMAAGLVLAATIVSSVVQPLFGHIADKKPRPYILAVGSLLAGVGMAVTGLIPNFAGLCIAVVISGVGVAAFHPEAAQLANKVSDDAKKGAGLSTFSFGGSAGFALGPIISTAAIMAFGLNGTLVLMVPAVVMCAAIFLQSRNLVQISQNHQKVSRQNGLSAEKDRWIPFSLLSIVVFGRSIVFCGLNTFLSLYWIHVLQQSESIGNTILSFFFAIGAASTFFSGGLADRFGFRRITRISSVLLVPIIFFLTLANTADIATLFLIPVAFILNLANSPLIVMGQKYLPNRLGLASGVTIGLSVSIGGILAPVLGNLADNYGLPFAMQVTALIAIIPAIMSFTLPKLKETVNKTQKINEEITEFE